MSNPTSSSDNNRSGISRRTVVHGAAWAIPVISVAVAAPLAAASGETPPATFWGTGATVSVVSGNVTNYTLEGNDENGDFAALPVGSTVTIVPGPGVTLELVDALGIVAVLNPDGSISATIASEDTTNVRIRFRPTGPSGTGYTITTNVAIEPFTEDIDVTIR